MQTVSSRLHESLAGGRVKGAMVRAHLQFAHDRLGDDGVARMLRTLPAAVATEVQSALASTWCAFESLVALDRAIAKATGLEERDLMRDLGRYSARINLSTVYRAFHRDDLHEFFRNAAMLHRQFQDFGDAVYENLGAGHARISVRNAVCFSPAYCLSEAGYLEQVIATHGGTAVSVTESTCQCASDDRCTFEMRWQ